MFAAQLSACDGVCSVAALSLPGRAGATCFTSGTCLCSVSCMGRWPSEMGWVPSGLCLWTMSCMWEPMKCLECWLTYFSYAASPKMDAPQVAQQQMQQHRMSWRVERTTTARHQPLTAWPPIQARKRPVAIQYTSAMRLQMLPRHSTSAKSAPQMPPAAPKPAQQHAKIQLRTITPPSSPHTTGSAVCGWLLPTPGTAGPATPGRGASGTLGKLRAVWDATWEPVFDAWDTASGASRRSVTRASTTELARKTNATRTAILAIATSTGVTPHNL